MPRRQGLWREFGAFVTVGKPGGEKATLAPVAGPAALGAHYGWLPMNHLSVLALSVPAFACLALAVERQQKNCSHGGSIRS